MLRARLLTATAAVALLAAPAAFAQDAMTPPAPTPHTTPAQAARPATPAQPAAPVAANTVVDVLKANGQFTTLVAALEAARLTETLRTQGAISIFAPTDAAFAALPEAVRTRLMDPANVNELRQLLLYHVVVADVNSSQIEGTKGGVETAARSQVQLDGTGEAIMVDEATVVTADIDASNGAIFAIDKVLSPASSQVATGDAEEAATDGEDDVVAAPPVDETDDAPADDDEDVATPPPPTAPVTTTAPRPTTLNAPSGQPATTSTTTASPPVVNPTDGQVDGDDDNEDSPTPTPTPRPQS